MTGNTRDRWGSVQIGAALADRGADPGPGAGGLGDAGRAPGPMQNILYNVHKNVGLIIFLLAVVRLGWRWGHPVPYLPADLPTWQATAARATHCLLYLLLFAMPLTGFLYTALSGYPVPLLMVWDLAKLVPVNKPLGEMVQARPSQPAMAALPDGGPARGAAPCSITWSARTGCCAGCCRQAGRWKACPKATRRRPCRPAVDPPAGVAAMAVRSPPAAGPTRSPSRRPAHSAPRAR